ncbi:conserved hypothetical protein [Ricinus communis]|uniref:Phthiocerol/phthiodiolone dimycocerosyl transferase C-terminal domain-containing protein n=1 Tax=Ricinus communis TaxID=3988 RepID=B9SWG5_RICCO|nr:conserved hypothetical protein [Ricinus communis]|eukprot:XP_002530334.1 uncharacterized protein LOC8263191 [Ricinus communis]
MSNTRPDNPQTLEPIARAVGGTEHSWCKAIPAGTGITVLGLLLSKAPNIPFFQAALHQLQSSHPILRSKLHFDTPTASFSYITPPSPHLQIQFFDLPSTTAIHNSITTTTTDNNDNITPYHLLLEHEMNKNSWSSSSSDNDLFFASVYTLSETRWVLVLRLHTSACDRASAAALLRELLEQMGGGGEIENYKEELGVPIEDCIPDGKSSKWFWARGMDVVGYSLNSFRLANLNFIDASSARRSQVIRLQINSDQTFKLVEGCKSRGIKLCGALAAAGLIAAHSTKDLPHDQSHKYAVVTLVDCRSILDPVLSSHNLGFYHSAILNTHDINGGDKLWEVAQRCYMSFANAKKNNKHFTDMGDLNFLMGKAIDNPGLTPSSSSRTACISVFEDPVIDESDNAMHGELGLEDYVGCASVHGVGPSLAFFDTIRNGRLDCACVYPSPLHSREQIQKLIDDMKRILVDSCANDVEGGET